MNVWCFPLCVFERRGNINYNWFCSYCRCFSISEKRLRLFLDIFAQTVSKPQDSERVFPMVTRFHIVWCCANWRMSHSLSYERWYKTLISFFQTSQYSISYQPVVKSSVPLRHLTFQVDPGCCFYSAERLEVGWTSLLTLALFPSRHYFLFIGSTQFYIRPAL